MSRILTRPDGATIAYHRLEGRSPGVVFLCGFLSDMAGTKALALDALCRARGQGYLRFDYQGHGESSGAFVDGTIGDWTEDALAAFDALTEGPQVLVGSSMGGWIALLLALARKERIAGLVAVAPAPDFAEDLMWGAYNEAKRATLLSDGLIEEPSDYGEEPYRITRALIEDGRSHLLLCAPIALDCPVRILHGTRDDSVPWERSLTLADALASDDVEITLVKDGDHRLSEEPDLARLCRTLETLLDSIETGL